MPVRAPGPAQLRIDFNMNAMGPVGDPRNPPSYSIQCWSGKCNLHASPLAGGAGYHISGTVDADQFGGSGVAVVGIMTAIALHDNAVPRP